MILNAEHVALHGQVKNGGYWAGCFMLTLKEAISIYKISQATMYRWIKQDKIPSKIIGGARYYDIDKLQNAYEKRHAIK
jgi:hypothetical protein